MEREVLALLSRRERRAGRELEAGPKDRELLVDQPKIAIALFELDHGRRDLAAVRAVVVEELDKGDVPSRVAPDRCSRIVQDLFAAFGNRPLETFRFSGALSLLQDPQRFHDDFGVPQEILANSLLELIELSRFARHRRCGLSVHLIDAERSYQRKSGHEQQTEEPPAGCQLPRRSAGFNRRLHGYSTA